MGSDLSKGAGKGGGSLPPPFRLLALDSIDSTNDEARRQADAGAGHGLVIMAAEQTAGRGRRGRQWVSPRGNLHCSLLLQPGRPLAEAAQLSFAAGLSLAEALEGLCPGVRFQCKWPNDVLCEGRKIAGMLLETVGQGDHLILGLGVDVVAAPDPALYPAISLREAGSEVSAEEVLSAFVARFSHWFTLWQSQGFAPLREAWLAKAKGLGEEVVVRLDKESVTGIFAGLDSAGGLMLDVANNGGRRLILAGDVFFPVR
ncbi:biotin--[acetyl-CoA-carboxylase] ligase [Telmatospirillum sp. J64-1]|uniref:biotin--[acetyl-CoA-carboxylase] ligase n=1 Tax=Telmatospirillum sp. J64-1 TaxID=2502183 RepID=UPI00115E07C8|nr:biotin--[acetyl-CoA-carboxylase] ligase [Telmatospirillum sp. J64-1]